MNRTRWSALAVLGFVAVAAACTSKASNGEECLKNADCESDRCVQYVCVDPNSSRAPLGDSGAAETAADAAPEAAPDTAMPPADTGTDTGTAADTSDASAD